MMGPCRKAKSCDVICAALCDVTHHNATHRIRGIVYTEGTRWRVGTPKPTLNVGSRVPCLAHLASTIPPSELSRRRSPVRARSAPLKMRRLPGYHPGLSCFWESGCHRLPRQSRYGAQVQSVFLAVYAMNAPILSAVTVLLPCFVQLLAASSSIPP